VTSPLCPKDLTLLEKDSILSSLIQSVLFALAGVANKMRETRAVDAMQQIFKVIFFFMLPPSKR
ncbi:hypothetical protein, partial [Mesorhizobium sp. M8A.F.Ca.ET.197.01.1.1]|uniref:hypothetical protein n=1 Tax=Mesorhizobium sp. M8A.F.Ca.ET.197.01.1.1 TaxID=2563965 RepID=UPI001AEE6201